MRNRHAEKPYQCETCGGKFSSVRVRAITFCEMFTLKRDNFQGLLAYFPDLKESMLTLGRKRYEQMMAALSADTTFRRVANGQGGVAGVFKRGADQSADQENQESDADQRAGDHADNGPEDCKPELFHARHAGLTCMPP